MTQESLREPGPRASFLDVSCSSKSGERFIEWLRTAVRTGDDTGGLHELQGRITTELRNCEVRWPAFTEWLAFFRTTGECPGMWFPEWVRGATSGDEVEGPVEPDLNGIALLMAHTVETEAWRAREVAKVEAMI